MRKLDLFWMSNKEWYGMKNMVYYIKDNAPEEVKKSFQHYLEQTKEKVISLEEKMRFMEIDDTVDIGKEPLPVSDKDKEISAWIKENMSLFMKNKE